MDKVRFYACLTCAKEFNQYSKFSFANIKVFIEACFNYPKNVLPVEIIMYECSDCEEEFDDRDEYEEHIDENRFYACLTLSLIHI